MSDLYVLDTSSIFAFTDQEDCAEEVERLLNAAKQHECRLEVCAMSLMELYYITLREQSEDEAIRLVALVKSWPVVWIYRPRSWRRPLQRPLFARHRHLSTEGKRPVRTPISC